MRYQMAIDLNRCIGCRTCVVTCKNHNAEPEGIWWNRVFSSGAADYATSVEVDGGPRSEFTPVSCQQCDNAPCVTACPTGASYIDDAGVVLVDYERCIGCRYCMTACPYNVRQFNWQKPEGIPSYDGKSTYAYGYPAEVRQDGHLVYTPKRPEGVVEKCTFCVQYTSEDEIPACCKGCPANARIFGDADDPDSAFSQYVADKETYVLGEEYNTHPKVVYIPSKRESQNWSGDEGKPTADNGGEGAVIAASENTFASSDTNEQASEGGDDNE